MRNASWYLFSGRLASYLEWAERARADWLAHNGASNAALLAQGIVFAVRRCLYLHPARLDDVLGHRKLQTGKRALAALNGLPWMMGMRPYPGHPGLPQRRGPSGGYRLVCKKAVRIGLIHGSGDDDRSGQYRSPQPFPIALSCMPTWWAGGDDRLLLASVWYWAVIINKVILLRKLKTGI